MPDSILNKNSEDKLSSSQLPESDASSMSSINQQNNKSEYEQSNAESAVPHINEYLLKSISDLHKMSMPNVMADFARRSGVNGAAFKAVADWNKGTMGKALDVVRLSGVNQSALKAIADWDKGTIAKALDVVRLSGVNQSALKAIADWDKGTIAKALDVVRLSGVNQSALKAIVDWDKGTVTKAMAEAVRFTRLDESFFSVAFEWSNSLIGRTMKEVVVMPLVDESFFRAAIDFSHSSTFATSEEEEEQSKNRIVEMFYALPPWSQQIVMWVIYSIFLGVLTDFAKGCVLKEINSVGVYVSSLLGNKPITKTDIISVNPEIKWEDLNHFRLITGENVRLRVKPSMKSEVIEVLNKNTAIAVMETKDRQWLFVQVYLGEEKVQGWVNRSYTKRIGL